MILKWDPTCSRAALVLNLSPDESLLVVLSVGVGGGSLAAAAGGGARVARGGGERAEAGGRAGAGGRARLVVERHSALSEVIRVF